jgi:hypothetical protein
MERSFFVVAFGVCLILAQDDQPQKLSQALSQGAVMQEPPKDIGETFFADVSDILGKNGDIIPLNQENGFPLPAISIAFDMEKKLALFTVAVQNGLASAVSFDICDCADIQGSVPDAPETWRRYTVSEVYADEVWQLDGSVRRESRGGLAVPFGQEGMPNPDTVVYFPDEATDSRVALRVYVGSDMYLYRFKLSPLWKPPWYLWGKNEHWFLSGEHLYPYYYNCPGWPMYAPYCYDWPRLL